MKRILFALFAAAAVNCAAQTELKPFDDSPLFDTQFLLKYDEVTELLKAQGFKEGFFDSPDDHKINYLLLERPEAEYTVILCAGWIPGRKEGIATFYALLPENCNILFFDARGHGKSDGLLLIRTWIYGQHEYKDILGALNFVRARTDKPIIIYGVCAGTFHAAHALLHLIKEEKIEEYCIKGFVFDSGWASLLTVSWSVPTAKANESLAHAWANLYGKKWKEVLSTIPYRVTSYLLTKLLAIVHIVGFFVPFAIQEKNTNLFDKIELLPIPIFYIHSHDDNYAPIAHAKYLAKKSQKAQTWWIQEPSKHACHCLKYKHAYREKLHKFLDECLI